MLLPVKVQSFHETTKKKYFLTLFYRLIKNFPVDKKGQIKEKQDINTLNPPNYI